MVCNQEASLGRHDRAQHRDPEDILCLLETALHPVGETNDCRTQEKEGQSTSVLRVQMSFRLKGYSLTEQHPNGAGVRRRDGESGGFCDCGAGGVVREEFDESKKVFEA